MMLLFHIGSREVSGALFLPQASGIPKIIFAVTEQLPIEPELDVNRFLERALKSLASVAGKISASGRGAPSRIFAVLQSPWYVSQTRHVSLRKNTPFMFTEELADDLIQKEIKLFSGEHLLGRENTDKALRPIELKNIRTTLNGYEIEEPLYKKARELQMTMFISMSGETTLSRMEEIIGKSFHINPIKFSSFAVATFTVVRDISPGKDNFLLVDAGGEVTDMFLVKRSVLCESISFPIGCNFFIRGIAEGLGSTANEAASLLALYKNGHAEEMVKRKIERTLQTLRAEWLRNFEESLALLSHDIYLPSKVFLTADEDFADVFAALIRAEQLTQYTLAESKFEIAVLTPDFLWEHKLREADTPGNPALVIDSVYINRFLANI